MSRRGGLSSFFAGSLLLAVLLGCGRTQNEPQWAKSRKIAGKENGLSHISGLLVDDKFAYVAMGGTLADQKDGNSGLRQISLETGEVSLIDNGTSLPQSEDGGLVADDKFIYWNAGGKIWRWQKSGGIPEAVVSGSIGAGIDLAVDKERLYWINHGYYSAGQPNVPKPVYSVPKAGGEPAIFAADQDTPHSIAVDEGYVYWHTSKAIVKKAKNGTTVEDVYRPDDGAGVDKLAQDRDHLYFGFRAKGESRWALCKISKTGGEKSTIVPRFSPKAIAVDVDDIYFFAEGSLTTDSLSRVRKSGGEVSVLDAGYASGAIAAGTKEIFFASLDDVLSIPK